MPRIRGRKGQYIRQLPVWTPENWNAARLHKKGRFRVYRPDYPKAFKDGMAVRAHGVWWLHYREPAPEGMDIHHKNGDRTDDRIANLELIDHYEHSMHHNPKGTTAIEFTCNHCGNIFTLPAWRVRQRQKEGVSIRFCSTKCRTEHPPSQEIIERRREGLKKCYAEGRRKPPTRWKKRPFLE